MSDFLPAYVPTAAGGSISLLRWAHVTAVDSTSFPVSGATVASTLSPGAGAAQYPDNGFATTPTARTIWYLGRTPSGNNAWDRTYSSGTAVIPLYTDQITTTSLPNAESFGNYEEVATFSVYTETVGAFFPPYPAIDAADSNVWLTVTFPIQVRTGPDLVLNQGEYTGIMTVVQNQPFTVRALISNSGQTAATNVAAGGFVNRSMSIPGMALTGPATLELIMYWKVYGLGKMVECGAVASLLVPGGTAPLIPHQAMRPAASVATGSSGRIPLDPTGIACRG